MLEILFGMHECRIAEMKKLCKEKKLNSANLKYILEFATTSDIREITELTEVTDLRKNLQYLLLGYLRLLVDLSDLKVSTRRYTELYQRGLVEFKLSGKGFNFRTTSMQANKYIGKQSLNRGEIRQDTAVYQILKLTTYFKFEETITGEDEDLRFLWDLGEQLERYCVENGYLNYNGQVKRLRVFRRV